jgi:cation transport regulator ChaB
MAYQSINAAYQWRKAKERRNESFIEAKAIGVAGINVKEN